jgi:hypothetical protein
MMVVPIFIYYRSVVRQNDKEPTENTCENKCDSTCKNKCKS